MRNEGLGSWPARRARSSPRSTALVHDGREWTYGELHSRVNRLAHALRARGVRRGDRVAYLGFNHPAFVETLFAAGALGAVFVPLNFRLTARELDGIVDDCGVRVLIHGPECADTVAGLRGTATLIPQVAVGGTATARAAAEPYEPLLAGAPDDPLDEPVGLDDLCMIMYTSGTTGRPKGAALTHGNIVWNTWNLLVDVDVTTREVTLVSAPMFHTAALNQTVLPTILKGGTCVLTSSFDVDLSYDLTESRGVSLMFGVPAMFQALAASPRWETADLTSVRVLICGGAPVPEPLIRTYHERGLVFLQGYGMTETSPGALLLRGEDSLRKLGSAGTPVFFSDVRVVRPDLAPTAPGETGEVLVQGPNVTPRYWERPAETAESVVEIPGEGTWFRTGDAAAVDEEGYVRIVDRIKDMFISGGENVYPAEVEEALYQHPAVAECAVVAMPDTRWGEVGRAFVVLREGTAEQPEAFLDFLDGRIARYKIPKSVLLVAGLPRNAAGKLLKSQLHGTTYTNPAN